jgi:aspartate-semialdehyde dehydrogenase
MKKFNVAILGATGAVGREMMKVLEERNFPINELRLLASERSVGKELIFNGQPIKVQLACETAFSGLDIVLGAATNAIAKEFAPHIVKAGAVFIDNSSAFRMYDDVPLVVPEINPDDAFKNKGIISNPNCSTIITLTAINAINKISKIQTIVASTYQAVSGAGVGGPAELQAEVDAIQNGQKYEPKVFSHQIAYNLIPKIGGEAFEGYTSEEMKLQNESRKILHLPNLKATCTCVRVPVVRSHSISATIVTEDKISVEDARKAIAVCDGCKLVDDLDNNMFPMPLDTSDQDIVFVGRIRPDLTNDKGLSIFCCGDQVRKGAATNAVQIAQLLTK